jgi:hypothetical protein
MTGGKIAAEPLRSSSLTGSQLYGWIARRRVSSGDVTTHLGRWFEVRVALTDARAAQYNVLYRQRQHPRSSARQRLRAAVREAVDETARVSSSPSR